MNPTVTTYEATAARSGRWWAVEIHGLPKGFLGVTQGRTLAEARTNAREVVALLLEVSEDSVAIELRVDVAEDAVNEVASARADRERAARTEQDTLARAARRLVNSLGFSQKDAAELLHLSPQRVAQLAPRKAGLA